MQGRKFLEEGQVGGGDNEKKRKLACGRSMLKFCFVLSNGHLDIFGPETQMKSICQKYRFESHRLMMKHKILRMDQIT